MVSHAKMLLVPAIELFSEENLLTEQNNVNFLPLISY